MIAEPWPAGYRVIGVNEAEVRFAVSEEVERTWAESVHDGLQTIHVYDGGLIVGGDLTEVRDAYGWSYTNVIVDGDLVVAGDLD